MKAGSHSGSTGKSSGSAKSAGGRQYGPQAKSKVKRAMHEMKAGTLRSGSSGKKVTSRKQAVAIGLSEARRSGGKVPSKSKGRSGSARRH